MLKSKEISLHNIITLSKTKDKTTKNTILSTQLILSCLPN